MPENASNKNYSKKLSAIMFTDLAGYTRIMGSDEEKGMSILRKNRSIQKEYIKKYGGKWLKEMGDGTMSSFPNISDAIYCAKEIQKKTSEDQDINLRIGIHIGEIIEENNDIYGNGVNIASRLESLAEPGSILISETVHQSIENNKDIESVFVDEFNLKNVARNIKVYAVKGEGLIIPAIKSGLARNRSNKIWLTTIGSFLILGILGVLFILESRNNSLPADGSTVVVFPFTIQGNDDINYLQEGMVDLVSSKLNGLFEFKTVDPHIINATFTADDISIRTPEELHTEAAKMGAGSFVLGKIIQLGESYRMMMTIYTEGASTGSAGEIMVESEEGLVNGLNELIRKTTSTVLKSEGYETEGLMTLSTENFKALKFYLKGENHRRKGLHNQAQEYYNAALEYDTTMSIAWLRLWQSCSWNYLHCNYSKEKILGNAEKFKSTLSEKLKGYVEAMLAHYKNDLSAEEQFRSLIKRYGEHVDYLIGLGEELFHHNEIKGRLPSEATIYFEKAWKYDPSNREMTNHLLTLLAMQEDSATLQSIINDVDYDSDMGYLYKGMDLLTSGEEKWTEQNLRDLLDHPQFNFRYLFSNFLMAPYLYRLEAFKTHLEFYHEGPFPMPPSFPIDAIIAMSKGKEAEAANLLQNNPYTNYVMPLNNIENHLDYMEEYIDVFPAISQENKGLLPYYFTMALQALNRQNLDAFEKHYKQLETSEDPDRGTATYLSSFLQGIYLRHIENFTASNDSLIMLLERTSDYNLPSFIVEHMRGAMKMAIAENYYSLGDKEKSLHWYNVRFNILNAGDEIMVGYSFLRRAELCEELERLPEALNFYKKFLDLYRNSDPKYSDWVKEATDGLSRIMRKVG